ncbi:MAG: hypothetical protein CVU30_17325 [Betaproteobacteria bacterium HGW-Betaproteobacteria-3]|nr:MAG: hypothetical protein CVU30_17325 [Betaproteobacteria bacterium HGW-Betaproteobacteria-3]
MRTHLTTLLLTVAGLFVGNASAQTGPAASAGTVKVVQGQARVVNATGERPLSPGDHVAMADRVITGADSATSLVLRDGTTLVVGPKSQLELKDFAFNSTTHEGTVRVSLLQGALRMITGLIAKLHPANVNVETDTVTTGVRGTDFIVEIEDVR